MSVQIIEMLAPIIGNGARSGLKRTGFRGVTIHNTGNAAAGAGAKNHGTYLQNSGRTKQASWHYAVDENYAVRSIPENEIAWHAGDGGNGDGNCKTIAIETCMNSDGNLLKATDNAAELAADILKRNGITKAVSGVNLFQHNHWSGKNCPQMIRAGKPYDWNTFVAKVNAHLGATTTTSTASKEIYRVRKTYADVKSQIGAYSILDNAKKMCDRNPGYKVFNSKGDQVYPAVATTTKPATQTTAKKTVDELAAEVLAGKHGNGEARKKSLGSRYAEVQARVDQILSGKTTAAQTITAKPAATTTSIGVGSTVYFDGKSKCYGTSAGAKPGVTPAAGNYKVTYYAKDAKYPIHIGSYGWVPVANCGVKSSATTTTTPAKKTAKEVANEIVNKPNYGGWGTGITRRNKLVSYGGTAFANQVQQIINSMFK